MVIDSLVKMNQSLHMVVIMTLGCPLALWVFSSFLCEGRFPHVAICSLWKMTILLMEDHIEAGTLPTLSRIGGYIISLL